MTPEIEQEYARAMVLLGKVGPKTIIFLNTELEKEAPDALQQTKMFVLIMATVLMLRAHLRTMRDMAAEAPKGDRRQNLLKKYIYLKSLVFKELNKLEEDDNEKEIY